MVSQLTTNGEGLRLFFTDDIYLVKEPEVLLNEEMQTDTKNEVPAANAMPALVEEPVMELIKTRTEFKFLGSNNRNILILVNDDHNDVSDEEGRELLRKIVKSINLTAGDFALLNYAGYKGASFEQLKTYFSSVIVFGFGVSPEQLGLVGHPLNTVVTEGGIKLVFSAELRMLNKDQSGKKILWDSLKQLEL